MLTAYGIETLWLQSQPLKQILQLQQCLPLTVLKRMEPLCAQCLHSGVATVLTVYGIETLNFRVIDVIDLSLQQCLPFTVLKQISGIRISRHLQVATVLTVYGIETHGKTSRGYAILYVATVLTVYGIETHLLVLRYRSHSIQLQQHLPFTVCAEGCEAAEKQSGNEGRTSQVPERSEGKTKVIKE